MRPGMITFPAPSTRTLFAGIVTCVRGPAARMRPFSMITTEFSTGVPPSPSTSLAPTIAVGGWAFSEVARAANRKGYRAGNPEPSGRHPPMLAITSTGSILEGLTGFTVTVRRRFAPWLLVVVRAMSFSTHGVIVGSGRYQEEDSPPTGHGQPPALRCSS